MSQEKKVFRHRLQSQPLIIFLFKNKWKLLTSYLQPEETLISQQESSCNEASVVVPSDERLIH